MKMMFLGAPGTGKGTYARRISEILNMPQISTGDLLRAARDDPEFGGTIKEYQDKGQPVPDEIVMPIVKKRLSQDDCKEGYILDAVAYNINQAKLLNDITQLDLVINLLLPDDIIVKKNLGRRVCKNCGNIYNIADIREDGIEMPPLLPEKEGVCDKCGGLLIERSDDTEEIIRERLRVYKERIEPVLQFYREKGIVEDFKVNASPEVMVPKLLEIIKNVKA